MATLKTTIRTPSVVRTIVRGMGRPGTGGSSLIVREVDGAPSGTVSTLIFPSGTVAIAGNEATINPWAPIYTQTTDPGVEGQPWNDNGLLRFSTPGLNFSLPINSMYISLIIEEF